MNQDYLRWATEVLILATGIYLFLRFLRSTRGSGVLRGLGVALLVGVVGLFGAAKALELEELLHIMQNITPYLAVILTILFQPELRRAITRLGEHNRLARFLGNRRSETVHEVAQAAIDMAARREGALIAFQGATPLEAHVENAVPIDAEVSKLLIEGIFHPGSALHDGGVVIVNDRIASAACIFPLTENADISKSTGTRHRAALGLTEETDAVILVVSEETGAISVCHRGRMDRHVAPERLETVLLERLGYELEDAEGVASRRNDGSGAAAQSLRVAAALFSRDVPRKLVAFVLAVLVIFAAHQDITVTEAVPLQVVVSRPGSSQLAQRLALEVRLPGEDYSLVSPGEGQRLDVEVSGTRAEVERAKETIRGVLTVGADLAAIGIDFPLDDVVWSTGNAAEIDVVVSWKSEPPPTLRIERFAHVRVPLAVEQLEIDATALDPRLQVVVDEVDFQPDSIELRGPAGKIERLHEGELAFELAPIVLSPDEKLRRTVQLELAQELRDEGLVIVQGAQATLEIIPAERTLGTIEKEIQVIADASREEPDGAPASWTVNQYEHVAKFRVHTAGIIPVAAEPGQQAYTEIARAVLDYVSENLNVLVRVSDREDGLTVPVRYYWPPTDWRAELSKRLGTPVDRFAEIAVVLEGEARVRLQHAEGQ